MSASDHTLSLTYVCLPKCSQPTGSPTTPKPTLVGELPVPTKNPTRRPTPQPTPRPPIFSKSSKTSKSNKAGKVSSSKATKVFKTKSAKSKSEKSSKSGALFAKSSKSEASRRDASGDSSVKVSYFNSDLEHTAIGVEYKHGFETSGSKPCLAGSLGVVLVACVGLLAL